MQESRRQTTVQFRPRLSLVQKAYLLLALPLIWQILLGLGLFVLSQSTEADSVADARRTALRDTMTHYFLCYYAVVNAARQALTGRHDEDARIARRARHYFAYGLAFQGFQPPSPDKPIVDLSRFTLQQVSAAMKERKELDTNPSLSTADRQRLLRDIDSRYQRMRTDLIRCGEANTHGHDADPAETGSRWRTWWAVLLTSLVSLNLGCLVLLFFFFSRSIVNRLALILDNSQRLAGGRELNPRLRGSDEIVELDSAFHAMVAALEEAAHTQKAMIANVSDLVCSLSEVGRFLMVSSSCTDILGYAPEELIGKNLLDLVVPEEEAETAEKLRQVISGKDQSTFTTRMSRKDGAIIDMLWSTTWSASEATMFCVVHDVTAKKCAERLQQEVVQMVSHDLRSPLSAIDAFHHMLEEGVFGRLNDKGLAMLSIASRNTDRMLALISDLLDLEKGQAGVLQLDKQEIRLATLFEQAIHGVLVLANVRGVELSAEHTDLLVLADERRLLQILNNLLSNAIKFTAAGKRVMLSASEVYGAVEIRVRDEGRGIPENMIQSVFERFCQVTASDAKDRGGSGLGLTICKMLVELHGGDITVESQVGIGSAFSFRIPSAAAQTIGIASYNGVGDRQR